MKEFFIGNKLQKEIISFLTPIYKEQEGTFEEHSGIGGIYFDYTDENRPNAEIITDTQMATLRDRGIMRNGLINALNDEKFLSTPTIEVDQTQDEAQIEAEIEAYVERSSGGLWDTVKGWFGK